MIDSTASGRHDAADSDGLPVHWQPADRPSFPARSMMLTGRR